MRRGVRVGGRQSGGGRGARRRAALSLCVRRPAARILRRRGRAHALPLSCERPHPPLSGLAHPAPPPRLPAWRVWTTTAWLEEGKSERERACGGGGGGEKKKRWAGHARETRAALSHSLTPPPSPPLPSPRRGPHGLPVQPRRRRHQNPAPHHPAHEVQLRVRAARVLPGHGGRGRSGAVAGGAAGKKKKRERNKKTRTPSRFSNPSLPLSLTQHHHHQPKNTRSTSNWRTPAWSGTPSSGRGRSWCGWSTSTARTSRSSTRRA